MIALNLTQILEFLLKKNLKANIQQETHQICVIFTIEQNEFPLFIRLDEHSNLLHLLTFIPKMIKPGHAADVARLLHLFNKEVDLPGFGMNEDTGHIFYRLVIPCPQKKVEESVLEAFLNSIQVVCQSFAGPIVALAEGKISFDTLMKQAKDATKKESK